MLQEKLEQLVKMLEKQELENSIQSSQFDPKLYHELFAAYLFLDDLVNARFLWMRIPIAVKNGNQELEQMHKVYEYLWKNEMVNFYKAMEFKWSIQVSEVMYELKEKIQMDNIQLIGYAYSSILEDVFAEMTNQTPETVEETCKRMGWEIQEGPYPRQILPKKPAMEKVSTLDAEDQLHRLTSYVSFLEN